MCACVAVPRWRVYTFRSCGFPCSCDVRHTFVPSRRGCDCSPAVRSSPSALNGFSCLRRRQRKRFHCAFQRVSCYLAAASSRWTVGTAEQEYCSWLLNPSRGHAAFWTSTRKRDFQAASTGQWPGQLFARPGRHRAELRPCPHAVRRSSGQRQRRYIRLLAAWSRWRTE